VTNFIVNQEIKSIITAYKSTDVIEFLNEYSLNREISFEKSSTIELIQSFEQTIAKLPEDLKKLYMFTNGFLSPTLELLPIFDKSNAKRTWDSINRTIDSDTRGFAYNHNNMSDFCVFGRLSPPNNAIAYKKNNEILCFEADDRIIETSFNLKDFIAICLCSDRLLNQLVDYL
jgi:hypothetical protein